MKIRLPVRSAIYKHDTGGLVVRWVTTSESPLLYVFALFLPFFAPRFNDQRHPRDGEPTTQEHDRQPLLPLESYVTSSQ